jgi:hypothetical protein
MCLGGISLGALTPGARLPRLCLEAQLEMRD